jgi:hypothetical protein
MSRNIFVTFALLGFACGLKRFAPTTKLAGEFAFFGALANILSESRDRLDKLLGGGEFLFVAFGRLPRLIHPGYGFVAPCKKQCAKCDKT